MPDLSEEARRLLEETRRAREEAERLRREAREEARRLREEARRAREDAARLRARARDERRAPAQDEAPAAVRRPLPPLDAVRRLEIDHTAGKLTVRTCAPGESPAVSAAAAGKSAPTIELHTEGDRLAIAIKAQRGWLFRRRQGADALVLLPEHAFESVRIANGYGEIHVTGLRADSLRISTGAGSIHTLQTAGALEASLGAGRISILAHAGPASAQSGTGDILLDLAALEPGSYRVDVGLGRAEVRIPPGAEADVEAKSGVGRAQVDVPHRAGAPASIKASSGVGEVVIKRRVPGEAPAAPPPPPSRPPSPAERRREAEELRVLQLLEQGRITPQDAADLIAALRGTPRPEPPADASG